MKFALVTIAALALGLAPVATARSLPAASPLQTPANIAEIDKRLDAAWADLNAKWMSGLITDREFQLVTDLLLEASEAAKVHYPEAGTIRARLQAVIDDLKARAVKSAKNQMLVDSAWEQIIDSRVNRKIHSILAVIKLTGPITRETWMALFGHLYKRAEAAKDDLEASTIRARLEAMIAEVQKKALNAALTETDLKPFREELAEERVHRAVVWLKAHTFGKKFTHVDFERVRDVVRDRGTLNATSPAVLQGYNDQIDRLEAAVGNDTMTADQFKKFMTQLNVRVRGALQ